MTFINLPVFITHTNNVSTYRPSRFKRGKEQNPVLHSSARTTEIYLKALDDELLDSELKKLYGDYSFITSYNTAPFLVSITFLTGTKTESLYQCVTSRYFFPVSFLIISAI